jgi:hypothetical protein
MRCYACDCELNDVESTRKSKSTREYLDLCDTCFSSIQETINEIEEEQTFLTLKKEKLWLESMEALLKTDTIKPS